MFILGILCVSAGGVLDLLFRERMTDLGHKWARLQGGAFNFSQYHKVRREHGWAAWPVYLMWTAYILGIALLMAGFIARFRASSMHTMQKRANTQMSG